MKQKQKLIILNENNKIISSLYDGKNMIEVNIEDTKKRSILGNIYIGKVKNIVTNINAAFIEIENGIMCYYSLAENNDPIYIRNMHDSSKGICIGDEIVVQVSRDNVKTKAPVVTSHLNFTGKYSILTYGKKGVGISSKITDINEKNRLKKAASKYCNEEYGFIIRTNSYGVDESVISNEMIGLISLYEDLKKYGVYKTCFSHLYENYENYICDIRDANSENLEEIVTDNIDIYNRIQEYLKIFQKEDLGKLRFYEDKLLCLDKLYSVNHNIREALKETVWLKSGGTIVIQPTEALVVIDVNTGKAISGKKKKEETFMKLNLEASKEIARQIKLRNLSGIIIIDFIDLKEKSDKDLLLKTFNELLIKDSVKTTLVDMTPLNLVEITRKKVRKPLYEQIADIV